ncbi:hypothetical protein CLIB1444_04S09912 [[Candida] jaroonii]|uniref:Uncharacterized protein n=1 Tax=[Candida] jaroonii TaxID=467808 RepID=A0ACA9Y7L5_9ASCO|nr:hypothetical protein CLIB1444_04S09912 [[Candida] jaroonii]
MSDNPLLNKLSKDQFNASVKFYEADSQLSHENRVSLESHLKGTLLKIGLVSYTVATLGFSGPSIYKRFYLGGPTKLIHRPFLSFLTGVSSLIMGNELAGRYYYQRKSEELKSQTLEYDAWNAMERHQLSLFYLYYLKTSQDESYKVKDPRSFRSNDLHQVHYNPPKKQPNPKPMFGESEAPAMGSEGSESIGSETLDPQSNGAFGTSDSELSTWERIRIANGYGKN